MKKIIFNLIFLLTANFLFAKDVVFQIDTMVSKSNEAIRKIEVANATRLNELRGKLDNHSNFALGYALKSTGDKYTLSIGDMEKNWTEKCDFIIFDVPENSNFEIRTHKDGGFLYIAIVEK